MSIEKDYEEYARVAELTLEVAQLRNQLATYTPPEEMQRLHERHELEMYDLTLESLAYELALRESVPEQEVESLRKNLFIYQELLKHDSPLFNLFLDLFRERLERPTELRTRDQMDAWLIGEVKRRGHTDVSQSDRKAIIAMVMDRKTRVGGRPKKADC